MICEYNKFNNNKNIIILLTPKEQSNLILLDVEV